ncbi:hypothetical protein [Jhaorihella thermophila]|uniref:PH domain-containing protein n=1 Tax=Jhaorihella thermophila TaxID=488547 RepID=A0A1H5SH70_9RHOB|nr:hypothetical protein [Jhaorihella thermophila]SEF49972.1 hypothetical protein SAMN05421751_101530 [Jhaorihella thermophila]
MSDLDDWLETLKQMRDEARLQLHLGTKEAQEEWEELMKEWVKFAREAQLEKSAEEVGEAARELGLRLKAAFDRMRKREG